MALDLLLALGLLLSLASQFRLGGLPVGPGELCLAAWIVLAGLRVTYARGASGPALPRMLLFWTAFALAQSLGTLAALAIGDRHDPKWFLHDALAYPLMAALGCLAVAGADAATRLQRTAWIMLALASLFLAPQLAVALGAIDLPFINPWFGDRFRGWSNNPNQLGITCAMLVLIALHLADSAVGTGRRLLALGGAVLPFWIGRLTQEDTFTFALAAALPLFAMLKLRNWLAIREGPPTGRSAVAVVVLAGLPLLLVTLLPFVLASADGLSVLGRGMMKNGGAEAAQEADLRLELWKQAIERGLQSGLLGLGPGPHLAIPPELVAARMAEPALDTGDHPEPNGLPNFEAHNTLLDLFAQGGLLASSLFVWLGASAFLTAYRARRAGLVGMLCGLGICAATSLIVRHPIFWFAVSLCLVADSADRPDFADARDESPVFDDASHLRVRGI
jgi:hypothetical protein